MPKKKADLKAIVEDGIKAVLESSEEPSDGRLKALALGIKMCALNAKLTEDQYGGFFSPDDEPGHTDIPAERPGAQPRRRRRANGTGADADTDTPAAAS